MEAIDTMNRIDLRRMRAESLTAAIMRVLDAYIAPEDRKYAASALLQELNDMGVEILSDYERAEMGLPPRGPDGWTTEEIAALEETRLEMLLRPIAMTIPNWADIERQKPTP
jgi:hypothetical protein